MPRSLQTSVGDLEPLTMEKKSPFVDSFSSSSRKAAERRMEGSSVELLHISERRYGSSVSETDDLGFSRLEETRTLDRLTRRMRSLINAESKQRWGIAEEEDRCFADMLRQSDTYKSMTTAFLSFQVERKMELEVQRHKEARWQICTSQVQMEGVVEEELERRRTLQRHEERLRSALWRLFEMEDAPLRCQLDIIRLARAEHVRRSFLQREEARAVQLLDIPNFTALPCHIFTYKDLRAMGIHGGAKSEALMMEKVDLMEDQMCPFRYAANCPFLPQRARGVAAKVMTQLSKPVKRRKQVVDPLRGSGVCVSNAAKKAQPCQLLFSASGRAQMHLPFLAASSPTAAQRIPEVDKHVLRQALLRDHYRESKGMLPSLEL